MPKVNTTTMFYVGSVPAKDIYYMGEHVWPPVQAPALHAPVFIGPVTQAFAQTFVLGNPMTVMNFAAMFTGTPAPTFTATGLPVGVTIDPATGTLRGTPTRAGAHQIIVTATNSEGHADSHVVDLTVTAALAAPIWISTPPARTFVAGTQITPIDLDQFVTANPAALIGIHVGTLPDGLTIQRNQIVGTPTATAVGSHTVQFTAVNSEGTAFSQDVTFTIQAAPAIPAWIQTPMVPALRVNTAMVAIDLKPMVTGLPTPTITVSTGTLPAGLALVNGVLSGTPTAAGTAVVVFRAENNQGRADTAGITIQVNQGVVWIAQPQDETMDAGVAITDIDIAAMVTGFPAPTVAVVGGTLPLGLTFTGGILSGTLTTVGTTTLTFRATNALGSVDSRRLTLTVTQPQVAPVWTTQPQGETVTERTPITPIDLAGMVRGTPTPGITAVGNLPPGVVIVNGLLTGTPTTSGTYAVTFRATNAAGSADSTSITFTVNQAQVAPTWRAIPTQIVTRGVAATQLDLTQFVSGVPAPTFSIQSGRLPPGLTLTTAGLVTGTPTATAISTTVKFRATNAAGSADSIDVPFSVLFAPQWHTQLPTRTFQQNVAIGSINLRNHVTGNLQPAITVKAGSALPAGLTLSAAGVISGTPTTVGTSSTTFVATNVSGTAEMTLDFDITAATSPPVWTAIPALSYLAGAAITPVDIDHYVSGIPAPTITVVGTLPAGLRWDATNNQIVGTPTEAGAGAHTIHFSATNSAGTVQSAAVTITINVAPHFVQQLPTRTPIIGHAVGSIDLHSLLNAATGVTYSATGLPPGMSVNPNTGVVSGTPTAAAGGKTYNLVFTATNAFGSDTVRSTWHVRVPPSWTGTVPAVSVHVGDTYRFDLKTIVAGDPTPTITVQTGTLPPGLSLTNGVISGTVTTAGHWAVTFRANNSTTAAAGINPADLVVDFTVAANATPPIWRAVPAQTFPIRTAVNFNLAQYVTGTAPITITASGLPAGLSINAQGHIIGTPTVSSQVAKPITVTATNAAGSSTTQVMAQVQPPPGIPTLIDPSKRVITVDIFRGSNFNIDVMKYFQSATPYTRFLETHRGVLAGVAFRMTPVPNSSPRVIASAELVGTSVAIPPTSSTFVYSIRAVNAAGTSTDILEVRIVTHAAAPTLPAGFRLEWDPAYAQFCATYHMNTIQHQWFELKPLVHVIGLPASISEHSLAFEWRYAGLPPGLVGDQNGDIKGVCTGRSLVPYNPTIEVRVKAPFVSPWVPTVRNNWFVM